MSYQYMRLNPKSASAVLSARKGTFIVAGLVATTIIAILLYLRHPFLTGWTEHGATTSALKPPRDPKNIAAIIETRPLSNLVPLLLHFSSVLGPAWPIVLFATETNLPHSAPLRRALDDGRISVRTLPESQHFDNHVSVSEFLTEPWFWEQLAPAGHILMFQADSILCSNSDLRVEDFLQYDFIGAPIDVPPNPPNGHGEGYNGGLSLRNRTMMLDIIYKHSWKGEKAAGQISQEGCVTQRPCLKFEDQWFYHKMKEMPEARLPTKEVASTFSVETVWYDTPLGYHQVERWNSNRMDKVAQWCPEYNMATSDLLVNVGKKPG